MNETGEFQQPEEIGEVNFDFTSPTEEPVETSLLDEVAESEELSPREQLQQSTKSYGNLYLSAIADKADETYSTRDYPDQKEEAALLAISEFAIDQGDDSLAYQTFEQQSEAGRWGTWSKAVRSDRPDLAEIWEDRLVPTDSYTIWGKPSRSQILTHKLDVQLHERGQGAENDSDIEETVGQLGSTFPVSFGRVDQGRIDLNRKLIENGLFEQAGQIIHTPSRERLHKLVTGELSEKEVKNVIKYNPNGLSDDDMLLFKTLSGRENPQIAVAHFSEMKPHEFNRLDTDVQVIVEKCLPKAATAQYSKNKMAQSPEQLQFLFERSKVEPQHAETATAQFNELVKDSFKFSRNEEIPTDYLKVMAKNKGAVDAVETRLNTEIDSVLDSLRLQPSSNPLLNVTAPPVSKRNALTREALSLVEQSPNPRRSVDYCLEIENLEDAGNGVNPIERVSLKDEIYGLLHTAQKKCEALGIELDPETVQKIDEAGQRIATLRQKATNHNIDKRRYRF